LKAKNSWNENDSSTDEFGFSAMPGGSSDGSFGYVGDVGYWWSATEIDSADAWDRYIYDSSGDVGRDYDNKSYLFSVRCLKN